MVIRLRCCLCMTVGIFAPYVIWWLSMGLQLGSRHMYIVHVNFVRRCSELFQGRMYLSRKKNEKKKKKKKICWITQSVHHQNCNWMMPFFFSTCTFVWHNYVGKCILWSFHISDYSDQLMQLTQQVVCTNWYILKSLEVQKTNNKGPDWNAMLFSCWGPCMYVPCRH